MQEQQITTHVPALSIVVLTSLEERRAFNAQIAQVEAARAAQKQGGVHAFYH